MKKISVITLQAVKNYGSVLQTFATQEVLRNLGYEVEIINFIREFNLDKNIADKITEGDIGIKKIVKKIILFPTISKWKKVFNTYLKDNINLTDNVYIHEQDFAEKPIKTDVFCVGSDQVWNTDWNDGIVGPLYLDFVHDIPKISFSSSVGVNSFLDTDKSILQDNLKEFSGITVRERSSISLLASIGIKDVQYCCDPTLLLDSSFWGNIAKEPRKCPRKYILLYQLNRNHEFDKMALEIARKMNCELVRLCMRYDQIRLPGKHIFLPSVEEFLWLINNADLVLTDSFHATAFSINFNKEFYVVYPNKFNSRIDDLLTNLSLQNRRIQKLNEVIDLNDSINYERVQNNLNDIREESMHALQKVLRSCNEK